MCVCCCCCSICCSTSIGSDWRVAVCTTYRLGGQGERVNTCTSSSSSSSSLCSSRCCCCCCCWCCCSTSIGSAWCIGVCTTCRCGGQGLRCPVRISKSKQLLYSQTVLIIFRLVRRCVHHLQVYQRGQDYIYRCIDV